MAWDGFLSRAVSDGCSQRRHPACVTEQVPGIVVPGRVAGLRGYPKIFSIICNIEARRGTRLRVGKGVCGFPAL